MRLFGGVLGEFLGGVPIPLGYVTPIGGGASIPLGYAAPFWRRLSAVPIRRAKPCHDTAVILSGALPRTRFIFAYAASGQGCCATPLTIRASGERRPRMPTAARTALQFAI